METQTVLELIYQSKTRAVRERLAGRIPAAQHWEIHVDDLYAEAKRQSAEDKATEYEQAAAEGLPMPEWSSRWPREDK